MSALVIARIELLRLLRERSNIFFVLVLPLLLVLLIGAMFGGEADRRLGVVVPADDDAAAELVAALDAAAGLETATLADEDTLVEQVSRGQLIAGILVPNGYAAAVEAGEPVAVGYVGRPDATGRSVRTVVEAAVAEQATVAGAVHAVEQVTGEPAEGLVDLVATLHEATPGVAVEVEEAGGDELAQELAALGRFDLGASSQLFLFVFLTAMTSSAALIQTRQYGVARRMLATPTPMAAILAGQAGGRLLVALFQAGYIVVATALLFGVDWGEPLATGSVIVLFSCVAAGAGMLIGSVFRNDNQAAGAGVGLGLVLAALGGSMMPLELFPEGMRTVAHLTPHAWANEAMAELLRRDGGVADVLPQLGALAGYAAVLLGGATVLLRRALTR